MGFPRCILYTPYTIIAPLTPLVTLSPVLLFYFFLYHFVHCRFLISCRFFFFFFFFFENWIILCVAFIFLLLFLLLQVGHALCRPEVRLVRLQRFFFSSFSLDMFSDCIRRSVCRPFNFTSTKPPVLDPVLLNPVLWREAHSSFIFFHLL